MSDQCRFSRNSVKLRYPQPRAFRRQPQPLLARPHRLPLPASARSDVLHHPQPARCPSLAVEQNTLPWTRYHSRSAPVLNSPLHRAGTSSAWRPLASRSHRLPPRFAARPFPVVGMHALAECHVSSDFRVRRQPEARPLPASDQMRLSRVGGPVHSGAEARASPPPAAAAPRSPLAPPPPASAP